MVITQTPFRMSFLGGGTDYRPFFEEHGGSVLTTSFDKYCYVTVRHQPRFFDYTNQITYSKIERTNTRDEIEHPAVREAMKFLDMHELRVVYEADLPARSGLGSSSAFTVGMLLAFHALKGKHVSKMQLSEEAIYVERELCQESGGVQDQIEVAFGGLNRVNFTRDGYDVQPIIISKQRKKEFNNCLMLFFTGVSRFSSEIAQEQVHVTRDKTAELKEMLKLVDDGERILTSKTDIRDFGRLLDYTWRLKRNLTNKISSDTIDALYQDALSAGAIGGKLLGAGGGGFLLLFVEPDKQAQVREKLSDLLYVPFEFENGGSRILYYTPEDYTVVDDVKSCKR